MSGLKDLAMKYLDCGKVVIPVNGKVPLVTGWSHFCDNLPSETEVYGWNWKNATGIGLPVGRANNICVVDIDNASPAQYKIIDQNIPKTPFVRVGAKGEGRLYRMPKNFQSPVRQIKDGDKVIVEFFYGNRQLVIPPSIHPETKKRYEWIYETFGPDTDVESLPDLPENSDIVTEKLLRGETVDKSKILSPGAHRHDRATSYYAQLVARGTLTIDQLITEMLRWDRSTNPNNRYFLDRTKGFYTNSEELNCAKFCIDNSVTHNRYKKVGERMDLPVFQREGSISLHFDELLPIKEEREEKKFDINWIPTKFRDFIVSVNETSGVPHESVLILMMASISPLIGSKVKIMPNPMNKLWLQSPNLYAMVSDNPGSLKTFISSISMQCLKRIDEKNGKRFAQEKKEFEAKKRIIIPQLKTAKSQLDKAATEGDGSRLEELALRVSQLEAEIEEPKRRIIKSEVSTPEALFDIITNYPDGHLIFENEFSSLEKMYQKKGYEMMRKMHTNGWDGTEPITYTTKSGGHQVCDKFCLSMIVNTQNDIIEKFIKSQTEKQEDDGLFSRFVFIKNKTSAKINFEKELGEIPQCIQDTYDYAYSLEKQEKIVLFDEEAKKIVQPFIQWSMIEKDKFTGVLKFAYGKARSQLVRMAYLLQFMDIGHRDTIGAKYAENAYHLTMLSLDNIAQIQENVTISSSEAIKIIADCVTSGDFQGSCFTIRQLYRSDYFLNKNKQQTQLALETLSRTNRIKTAIDNGVERYYINPAWKEELQK